jgi:hypothetical protein
MLPTTEVTTFWGNRHGSTESAGRYPRITRVPSSGLHHLIGFAQNETDSRTQTDVEANSTTNLPRQRELTERNVGVALEKQEELLQSSAIDQKRKEQFVVSAAANVAATGKVRSQTERGDASRCSVHIGVSATLQSCCSLSYIFHKKCESYCGNDKQDVSFTATSGSTRSGRLARLQKLFPLSAGSKQTNLG